MDRPMRSSHRSQCRTRDAPRTICPRHAHGHAHATMRLVARCTLRRALTSMCLVAFANTSVELPLAHDMCMRERVSGTISSSTGSATTGMDEMSAVEKLKPWNGFSTYSRRD